MKVCRQCNENKDDSLFHRHPKNSDGLQSYCIQCQCENKRKIYQRDKEKRKADAIKRYRDRKDAGLITDDEKSKKRAYDQQYRQLNSERLKSIKKAWAENNKHLITAIKKSYKSRRRAKEKEGDSTRAIYEWAENQEKRCSWCGVECYDTYHIDHIMPLALGGKHEISNLCISCPACNVRKNAKHPDEWRKISGR